MIKTNSKTRDDALFDEKSQLLFSHATLKVLLLNGAMVLITILCGAYFETNDDLAIAWIASGAFGTWPIIPFIGALYGQVLRLAYWLAPQIQWYVLLHFTALWLAFSAMDWLMIKLSRSRAGAAAMILASKLCCWSAFVMRGNNFTRTAEILAAAGFGMLFYGLLKENNKCRNIGFLLILWAHQVRGQAVFLISVFAFVFWIYITMHEKQFRWNKQWFLSNKSWVIAFCLLYGLVFLLEGLFQLQWNLFPTWKEYQQFNLSRSQVLDFPAPSWELYQKEYEKLGLSLNDAQTLYQWTIDDPEFFGLERMGKLSALSQTARDADSAPKTDLSALFGFMQRPLFLGFVGFTLVCVLAYPRKALLFLLPTGLGAALTFIFLNLGRAPTRVLDGVWLGAGMLLWGFLKLQHPKDFSHYKIKTFLVCAVLGSMLLLNGIGAYKLLLGIGNFFKAQQKIPAVETFRQQDENFYLLDAMISPIESGDPPTWRALPRDYFENISPLGSWMTFSPANQEKYQSFGFENPMRALVENEKVFLIGTYNAGTKLVYIREHYAADASLSIYETNENFDICKITATREDLQKDAQIIPREMRVRPSPENDEWFSVSGTMEARSSAADPPAVCVILADPLTGEKRTYRVRVDKNGSFTAQIFLPDFSFPDRYLLSVGDHVSARMGRVEKM